MNNPAWLLLCLIVFSAAAQSPVPAGAKLEKIADGFQFVEGPVWKDGQGLLFSDINGNTIYQWTEENGATVYLRPSRNSNGLTFDLQGRLILTQMGLRRVARREGDGTIAPLAETYHGKKLNSPNDVVVKSDGAIFFTDPPFNIPTGQGQELPFSGIFRIGTSGNLRLLDSTLAGPNGICFSTDESKLYVNNSAERVIYVWDVVKDSMIANKRRFASMKPSGYADGMKVDAQGNLFCAGPLGIWIFSPNGTVLDTILVPGQTANCNWGDADRGTLYITSGNSVYRIRMTTNGVLEHGTAGAGSIELHPNYPNPFNPETVIPYKIPRTAEIQLVVWDVTGKWIRTVASGKQSEGDHRVIWDGRDESGRLMPSGVYVVILEAGGLRMSRKILLMK